MTVIGSVCSGYDGLAQGIAAAFGGASLAYVADNDPGAEAILAHRYPGVPNLGDIRTARWEDLPPADVFCAGFPCQPASAAGNRGGLDDERWIWPAIAEGIGRLGSRPGLLVLENVPGLLTVDDGRAMAQVVYSLAALGYVGRYGVYSASGWAGACHLRKRLFIVAADADAARLPRLAERDGGEVGGPGASSQRHDPDRRGHPAAGDGRLALLPTPAATLGSNGGLVTDAKGREGGTLIEAISLLPTPTSHVSGRTGEQHMAMRASIGRKAPSQLEAAVQLLPTPTVADADGGRAGRSGARSGELLLKGLARDVLSVAWGKYEPAIRRWEAVTGLPAPCPVEPGRNGNRRLAAPFPEWMMGLPPGWVSDVPGLTRVQMLRAIGNGVVPQQAAAAVAHLLAGLRLLPVAPRTGLRFTPVAYRVPRPPAGEGPPAARVGLPFGCLGGEVLGGEGEGPAGLVSGAGVGGGDGLAVKVADGAAAPAAGVGGADVAGVEPEPGVGAGGEEVLDGAEPGGDAVAAVVAGGGGSPLGPHGLAECGVAGLGPGAGSEVPGHAITVAAMRRRDWLAAWAVVLGAVFLPVIMAAVIGVAVEAWRAVAG